MLEIFDFVCLLMIKLFCGNQNQLFKKKTLLVKQYSKV